MITKVQYNILRHASDTGRYVAGVSNRDWPEIAAMVEAEQMRDYGPQELAGGDHYLTITSKGRAALNEWQAAQPKPAIEPAKRKSAAFAAWRKSDTGMSFQDFAKWWKEKRP